MIITTENSVNVVEISTPEREIIESIERLKSLTHKDKICVSKVLQEKPFTDKTLSQMGGNVPGGNSRLFKQNYVRLLPTTGNALRKSIDNFEKLRTYELKNLRESDGLYYQRAISNVIADLDLLDLLRNSWLDAIQDLEASSSSPDDDDDLSPLLHIALDKGNEYIKKAQISSSLPPEDIITMKNDIEHFCNQETK
eukprot:CAMPEP_0197300578 /NCGR_PEP_ID=MMETSP0890-20130614/48694_1 /TAXON_ID=44058 ORGANISM="Aureoumbra lagunensis, Strain CCMP1510" /NCGR_SAMPLE_ID=MMETSP0890 /ASSEMBLY_ACC=CAM_ASM_000533 /LENGTH=195 /DNA_ID=CAMNT_0042779505 /DNA_START=219 /DNA_END=809 /DNA_ORIENTATION=-